MGHPVGQVAGHGGPMAAHVPGPGGSRRRTALQAGAAVQAPALEMRGVTRAWRAGAAGCSVAVRALRGVDLAVYAGEVVALVGGAGAGKTTLLLCAAGLVRPEGGCVAGSAAGRASYVGGGDPWMPRALDAIDRGARVLLLDVLDAPGFASPRAVAALAGSAAAAGLAVIVAARDPAALPAFATRLVTLSAGRIVASVEPLALLSRFVARGGPTP